MPRGRFEESPEEAKRVSERRIFDALAAKPTGLRFNELKQVTGLHQDTLSNRLRELMALGAVVKAKRMYRLSRMGLLERDKRELLYRIGGERSYVISLPGDSLKPIEKVIYRSITGYAFPNVPHSFLLHLKAAFHQQFFHLLIDDLIEDGRLEPDFLTKECDIEHSKKRLSRAVKSTRYHRRYLTFAFKIDLKTLFQLLNREYLERIRSLSTFFYETSRKANVQKS